ncbi:glycosyltransferase family 2 protein [Neobacillus sp. OS1-33]|uniref:glycosyltransferase family 2 protein n=1 Tax=Neobacillus sp. OS1-33 TaxID=3070683 RepID=UPI0027E1DAA3|nr:glycosyltransferase family 2 protein [Neobacillus sp. OS1-33]WML25158.1 glycosyltransferase family 2 protein [Neobacillus sp. OS1-33]
MGKIKPIISIIVPVYNVEKYINRCIESILAQTFSDFELILINDGSTDKSGTFCEYYAKEDSRIKVIHINNGGVSNARNTGIALAQGNYLMFCDSDDYVETNWCSELYETIKQGGNILPVSGIRFVYQIRKQKEEIIKVFPKKESFDKGKYFETYKKGLSGSLCCKIYDRKIIVENSIFFDIKVNRGEDLLFNLNYMSHMESFVTVPTITYNYVHSNEFSLMNGYRKDLFDIALMVYYAWKNYFKQNNVDTEQIEGFATYYYLNFLNVLQNTFDKRNKEKLVKKLIYNNRILNSSEFTECIELADTSKEDSRYIKLLKTNNYYLVWFLEQAIKLKKYLLRNKSLFRFSYFKRN